MGTPQLITRVEEGLELPALVWRFDTPTTVAATAPVGGGLGVRHWVINAQVAQNYQRRDQRRHGSELAAAAGLLGDGVVMFTAADIEGAQAACNEGVCVQATVGLTHPTWAADADDAISATSTAGTINIMAYLPIPLAPAAMLNALCTATEAKSQALFEAGVPGTGTASDAVSIACPTTGAAEPFAGPRSTWGARLARAVHAAVLAGSVAPAGTPPRRAASS